MSAALDKALDNARASLAASQDRLAAMIDSPPWMAAASSVAAWRGVQANVRNVYGPRAERLYAAYRMGGDEAAGAKAALVYADIADLYTDICEDGSTLTVATYLREVAGDVGELAGEVVGGTIEVAGDLVAGAAKGAVSQMGFGTLIVIAIVALVVLRARVRA